MNVCTSCISGCECAFTQRFRVQCKRIMAKTERGTELTTVVLDRDVIGQELVLTSHTNEQRTSSPVETRMEGGRDGARKRKCGWGGRQERIRVCRHTTLSDTCGITWCFCKSECWGNLTSYPAALFQGKVTFPIISLLFSSIYSFCSSMYRLKLNICHL